MNSEKLDQAVELFRESLADSARKKIEKERADAKRKKSVIEQRKERIAALELDMKDKLRGKLKLLSEQKPEVLEGNVTGEDVESLRFLVPLMVEIEKEKDRLKVAQNRAAAAEKGRKKMEGINTEDRKAEKTLLVLRWVYEFGWTSTAFCDYLCSISRSNNFSRKLWKDGYIKRNDCESTKEGTPRKWVELTEEGIDYVQAHLPDAQHCEYKHGYSIDKVRHDYTVQRWLLDRLLRRNKGVLSMEIFSGFTSERRLAVERGIHGQDGKQLDLLLHENGKDPIGIEVELSKKTSRKFDQWRQRLLVLDHGVMIFAPNEKPHQLLNRLKRFLAVGQKMRQWYRLEDDEGRLGHWRIHDERWEIEPHQTENLIYRELKVKNLICEAKALPSGSEANTR